jgi:hypothetical protein
MEATIKKNIEELNKVAATIRAINDQLDCLLYDIRYNAGLCVECGCPVEEAPDEYCDKCYKEAWSEWENRDEFTLRAGRL